MGRTDSNQGSSWRKSKYSKGDGACVDVASNDGMVVIRDSKNPDGPAVRYTAAEWSAFLDRARKGEFDNLGDVGQVAIPGLSPRGRFDTANLRDCLLGLLSDVTENEETLSRNLKFFRFIRSTFREVVAAVLVGSLIFGAGVAAAVTVAGMHIAVALSIGAGGSATFILTAAVRSRRFFKAVLSALSATDRHGSKSDPGTPEAEDRRRAA